MPDLKRTRDNMEKTGDQAPSKAGEALPPAKRAKFSVVCWYTESGEQSFHGPPEPLVVRTDFTDPDNAGLLKLADDLRVHVILKMLRENHDQNARGPIRAHLAKALTDGTFGDYFEEYQDKCEAAGCDRAIVGIRREIREADLLHL